LLVMVLFAIGELAETKIVFGAKQGGAIWIEARIVGYNVEDDTYDIDVKNAEKHRVNPRAIHVPTSYIRKRIKESDIAQMLQMGYDYDVARKYLSNANGNINLALSNLIDQNKLPTSSNQRKKLVSKESKVFEDPSAPSSPPIDQMPADAIIANTQANDIAKPPSSPPAQNPDQCHMAMIRRSEPRQDEFDYAIVYNEADLGFEFHSTSSRKKGINAIVGKRVTEHAVKNIFQGSLMLAVNDTWVVGMKSNKIEQICEKALRQLPCTVTFRGKKWMREAHSQRGTLKVLVVAACQLYDKATHVTVRVGDALLSTDKVEANTEPSWEEVMMWRSYRPDHNKHAVVRIWQYSRLTSSKCIGRAKVKLPSVFNECMSETVTLKSDDDEVRGILILRTMVQKAH